MRILFSKLAFNMLVKKIPQYPAEDIIGLHKTDVGYSLLLHKNTAHTTQWIVRLASCKTDL